MVKHHIVDEHLPCRKAYLDLLATEIRQGCNDTMHDCAGHRCSSWALDLSRYTFRRFFRCNLHMPGSDSERNAFNIVRRFFSQCCVQSVTGTAHLSGAQTK